ncbi:hypothetical protein QNI16_02445 [Cytophagaceae bacterium YF14B1]|uniref:Uncharacterized protein n=1 Tax=Xanthocytophaga flava TaxID=3048013 RepID=A0AAE3U4J4_9BACT|nr:hypothetical protein [Xanthocytophaga flavus]MDJ1479326.1 hypothetical protein [Xanthocytophaga flavus]
MALSAQQWNKAETHQLLNQLHQSGVISKQGIEFFYKSLASFDNSLYEDYLEISKPSMYFSSVSDSTQQDTVYSLSPAYLLSQFSLITQIIDKSSNELYQANGQKAEIKKLVQKYESLIGPVWRNTLLSPNNPKLKPSSDKDQLYKQLQTDFYILNDTLHKYQVIDEKIYHDVKTWIENEFIRSTMFSSLFAKAFAQSSFYEGYEQSKQEQIAYMDTLQMAGILSESSLQTLKQSYKPYTLLEPSEILTHCQRAFVLDFKTLPEDNLQALLQVYTMIRESLLPEFDFTYQKTFDETFKDEEYGGEYTQTFLEFTVNKTSYQQRLSFTPKMALHRSVDYIVIDWLQSGSFQIVNDFLTDRSSSLRLFVIDDKDRLQLKIGTRIGFILMDSIQVRALEKAFPMSIGLPIDHALTTIFDNTYNRPGLTKMIQEYESIGIIPTYSKDSLAILVTKMVRDNVSTKEDILTYLPNIVAHTDYHEFIYDGMEEEPKNVYQTFLHHLQHISQNSFTPTNIVEKQTKKGRNKISYEYGFNLNGKTYTQKMSDIYSFLWEGEFIQLVNQALKEANAKGSFYSIGYSSNKNFIFLTPEQYQYLKTSQPELFTEHYQKD